MCANQLRKTLHRMSDTSAAPCRKKPYKPASAIGPLSEPLEPQREPSAGPALSLFDRIAASLAFDAGTLKNGVRPEALKPLQFLHAVQPEISRQAFAAQRAHPLPLLAYVLQRQARMFAQRMEVNFGEAFLRQAHVVRAGAEVGQGVGLSLIHI